MIRLLHLVWFFTGNMNLVLLLSGLLLGNSTNTEINVSMKKTAEVESQLFEAKWQEYKLKFLKQYDTVREELLRKEIFRENDVLIEEHNKLFEEGYYFYELGHNQFSDITHNEYLEKYTTSSEFDELNHPTVKYDKDITVKYPELQLTEKYEDLDEFEFLSQPNIPLPTAVDWRAYGAVTPVKNEGHCSASWAFSATGAIEGQLFRKTNLLISLSEQNLLDCTKKYGNKGCTNGTAANAFKYVISNGGINTNVTYPWHGKQAWRCQYKKLAQNPIVSGLIHIKSGNETDLAAALATRGPVSVAVDARSNKFKFYKKGIFNDPNCSSSMVNRELLVVGYGRSFWIVKNSWGTKWGANGYIYIARNRKNQCGIATRALYPIV